MSLAAEMLPSQRKAVTPADPKQRAEALSRYCSGEFDDPGTKQYRDCTEAIQLFEQLSMEHPNDIQLLLTLGRLYTNRSLDKAIRVYEQVVRLAPRDATAHFELGVLLSSLDARISHLRTVIDIQPNHPEAHGRLAQALLQRGSDINEVIEQIKQQISVNPARTDPIVGVIEGLIAKGYRKEAAQVFAVYLRSSLPQHIKCAGTGVLSMNEYNGDPDAVAAFAEQCPGYSLYRKALSQPDAMERSRLLQQALASGETDAKAHAYLANTLLELRDIKGALTEIEAQIELNPIAASDEIFKFAAALRGRILREEANRVYLSYLASSAPDEAICEPFRKELEQLNGQFPGVREAFAKRCLGSSGPRKQGY
jgi:cytochrome c-type biogenesis protein CcmH/NrfG